MRKTTFAICDYDNHRFNFIVLHVHVHATPLKHAFMLPHHGLLIFVWAELRFDLENNNIK